MKAVHHCSFACGNNLPAIYSPNAIKSQRKYNKTGSMVIRVISMFALCHLVHTADESFNTCKVPTLKSELKKVPVNRFL